MSRRSRARSVLYQVDGISAVGITDDNTRAGLIGRNDERCRRRYGRLPGRKWVVLEQLFSHVPWHSNVYHLRAVRFLYNHDLREPAI